MKPHIFLLGGHDLEMLEIRSLLQTHKISFIDRHLVWGAKWNDYQDIIDQPRQPTTQLVGIELSGPIPTGALLIDHHNQLSGYPSSIEQVAHLLNIFLSWHQKLIAANDKGYIPAMREIGATEEEIQSIRRLDRQAQGVTEDMERQAEEDCRKTSSCNHILIVKTNLSKFSPIVDRLQVSQLIVYNATALVYYGKHASNLAQVFRKLVANNIGYYGGGPDGYFGFSEGSFKLNEIENFISTICTYFKNT